MNQRSEMNAMKAMKAMNAMNAMNAMKVVKVAKVVKVVKLIRRRKRGGLANSPTGSTEGKPEIEGDGIGVDRTERLPIPWVDHCVQVCFINALVAIRAPNLPPVCMSIYHQSVEYSLPRISRRRLLASTYGTSASALAWVLALFGHCIWP